MLPSETETTWTFRGGRKKLGRVCRMRETTFLGKLGKWSCEGIRSICLQALVLTSEQLGMPPPMSLLGRSENMNATPYVCEYDPQQHSTQGCSTWRRHKDASPVAASTASRVITEKASVPQKRMSNGPLLLEDRHLAPLTFEESTTTLLIQLILP